RTVSNGGDASSVSVGPGLFASIGRPSAPRESRVSELICSAEAPSVNWRGGGRQTEGSLNSRPAMVIHSFAYKGQIEFKCSGGQGAAAATCLNYLPKRKVRTAALHRVRFT